MQKLWSFKARMLWWMESPIRKENLHLGILTSSDSRVSVAGRSSTGERPGRHRRREGRHPGQHAGGLALQPQPQQERLWVHAGHVLHLPEAGVPQRPGPSRLDPLRQAATVGAPGGGQAVCLPYWASPPPVAVSHLLLCHPNPACSECSQLDSSRRRCEENKWGWQCRGHSA